MTSEHVTQVLANGAGRAKGEMLYFSEETLLPATRNFLPSRIACETSAILKRTGAPRSKKRNWIAPELAMAKSYGSCQAPVRGELVSWLLDVHRGGWTSEIELRVRLIHTEKLCSLQTLPILL